MTVVLENETQSPEVFYKDRCSENFCNIHRKTPVLQSLFNKAFRPAILLKRNSNTGAFL